MTKRSGFGIVAMGIIAVGFSALVATRTEAAEPPKNTGAKPTKHLRRIPAALKWTCTRSAGEYTCTDPKTNKNYLCTNDPEKNEKVCDVGNDTIPGSTNP
jgi:hypothetical protein